MPSILRELTRAQLTAFVASLLGWSLDAFDFFIFVFCLRAISSEFHTDIKSVAEGVFLTLAFRPLGALLFGWLVLRREAADTSVRRGFAIAAK